MSKLYVVLPKVNTRIFDTSVGNPYPSVSENIPEGWQLVHDDGSVHVYKTEDKCYTAILATDNDNLVRYCDVKRLYSDGKYYSIYLYNGIFDSIRTYTDIKNYHIMAKKIEEKYGIFDSVPVSLDLKMACRMVYHRDYIDQLSVPVLNSEKAWRTVSDDAGDNCTDFIIIPDKWGNLWGTEDEEKIWDDIEEFIYDSVGYRSGYDFPTGKMITLRWGFHRTHSGVAIWHERGIDW